MNTCTQAHHSGRKNLNLIHTPWCLVRFNMNGWIVHHELTCVSFLAPFCTGTSFTYTRKQVFRVACDWRYAMFLHEYPETNRKHLKEGNILGNYNINSRRLGARNKTIRKYLKDALRFEKALDLEMTRKRKSRFFTRMLFYCANSWYDDAGSC